MSSVNSMLNRAAQSILDSDRNKRAPYGQNHPHVQFVEVTGGDDEAPFLTVKAGAGPDALKSTFPIAGRRTPVENRAIVAADLHDLVLPAFLEASQDLALEIAKTAAETIPS